MAKTIAAIATPAGMGGVAIIRISGVDAVQIASRVFRCKKPLDELQPYFMQYGSIIENEKVIDKGLLVIMRAPHSFTGEDVAELHCHGGIHVTQRILDATLAAGASLAMPGEFTRRAFINGKIDLIRAEAIGDIIHARTDASLYQAVNHLSGGLSCEINSIRDALTDAAAQLAVAADYPEEDIDFEKGEQIKGRLAGAHQSLCDLIKTAESGRMLREGILCVMSGRPNTGKSSLLNALLGENRAIVTEQEGTTRDVIEESITYNGVCIRIADTAGIRHGENKAECIGIELSQEYARKADVSIVVIDSAKFTDEDEKILEITKDKNRIIVFNKTDLANANPIDGEKCVFLSAKTGDGIEELKKAIIAAAGNDLTEADKVRIVNTRQKEAAMRGAECIENAIATINDGFPADLSLSDIENAIDALGEMSGLTVSDEITDRIFAKFCLGK